MCELAREAVCLHAYENRHVLLCCALRVEGTCGRLADAAGALRSFYLPLTSQPHKLTPPGRYFTWDRPVTCPAVVDLRCSFDGCEGAGGTVMKEDGPSGLSWRSTPS